MIDFGHGVTLEPLDRNHLELYRDERNDPAIRMWCRQKGLISAEQQEAWYLRQDQDPTIHMLEVWGPNGEVAGVCGLTDIDHFNQRAEFSLYIFTDYQDEGYGTKALRTLCDYGFNELNLNMIWGETVGENPATKMFRKVGFENTGYRPSYYWKEGKWQNSYMYSLLRDNWQSSR